MPADAYIHSRWTLIALAFSVGAAAATGGCSFEQAGDSGAGASGTIDGDMDAKDDFFAGNGAVFPTANGNVELLGGYNTLFDRTTAGRCVETEGDESVLVGSASAAFDLMGVSSRSELARQLGLDLGLKIRYGALSSETGLGFVDMLTESEREVSVLIRVTEEYTVRNRSALRLGEGAIALLEAGDVSSFTQRCGTNYVNGVRFGAYLYVLITLRAEDSTVARSIRASLGFGAGIGVEVAGDIEARLAEQATRSGVSLSIRTLARGFDLGDSPLAGTGLSSDRSAETEDERIRSTFAEVARLRDAMRTSVANDRCRDSGFGDCEHPIGYAANTLRHAESRGIELGFYQTTPNVEWSGSNPFLLVQRNHALVSRYIRELSAVEEQMKLVYDGEIAPFLSSAGERRLRFNVAPPGEPARTHAALRQRVTPFADLFRAASYQWFWGQVPASDHIGIGQITEAIRTCWEQAAADVSETCFPEGAIEPERLALVTGGLESLAWYRNTARVVGLDLSAVDEPLSYTDAARACDELVGPDDVRYRLPERDEAPLLGPYVAEADLPFERERHHRIWYRDAVGECTEFLTSPTYINDPSEPQPSFECLPRQEKASVICVPEGGPLGHR